METAIGRKKAVLQNFLVGRKRWSRWEGTFTGPFLAAALGPYRGEQILYLLLESALSAPFEDSFLFFLTDVSFLLHFNLLKNSRDRDLIIFCLDLMHLC